LPDQIRPLRDLEPVLRTLASLDVDQTQYRYYPEVLREAGMADADEDAQKWLKLAKGLDYSAGLLIQFALDRQRRTPPLRPRPGLSSPSRRARARAPKA
jgi:hypothetical protein